MSAHPFSLPVHTELFHMPASVSPQKPEIESCWGPGPDSGCSVPENHPASSSRPHGLKVHRPEALSFLDSPTPTDEHSLVWVWGIQPGARWTWIRICVISSRWYYPSKPELSCLVLGDSGADLMGSWHCQGVLGT